MPIEEDPFPPSDEGWSTQDHPVNTLAKARQAMKIFDTPVYHEEYLLGLRGRVDSLANLSDKVTGFSDAEKNRSRDALLLRAAENVISGGNDLSQSHDVDAIAEAI